MSRSGLRRRVQIPLYINILTMFCLLIFSVCGLIIGYNQYQNSQSALIGADLLLGEVGSSVDERTKAVFETAFMTAETYSWSRNISAKPTLVGHPLAPMFIRTLAQNKNLTALYVGYEDGDFYLVSSLEGRDEIRKSVGAPDGAMWYTYTILHRADGTRYELRVFRNQDLGFMNSRLRMSPSYDPRTRPWYQKAIRSAKSQLSDIYIFSSSDEPGISVSRRFDGNVQGVFSMDLSLSQIARFLDSQRIGEKGRIMVFDLKEKLHALPDSRLMVKTTVPGRAGSAIPASIRDIGDPVLNSLYDTFASGGMLPFHQRIFTAHGEKYIGRVSRMPRIYGKGTYLGMATPLSTFTGPIAEVGRKSLIISILALLLFIPVVIWASRRITRPLDTLMNEVTKIRSFELDDPVAVNTRITEINRLSRALETMRVALQSFGKYIPSELVKNLITRNVSPDLGGERRMLTIFFSDIQDFTTLSETMPAETLTESISDYFRKTGKVIIGLGGTIDKYIGDAIMAYWNAPRDDFEHAVNACLAALKCRATVHAFNAECTAAGRPPLHTRFGLHTDEAIVGNIGSSDRMNYTAMGAAVNMASRLEGLNKFYETEILVSDSTAAAAGEHFVFRKVGRAIPKGSTTSLSVLELVGTRPQAGEPFDRFCVSEETLDYMEKWDMAYDIYLKRDFSRAVELFEVLHAARPHDTLAKLYMESAAGFRENHPGPEWDGTTTFKTK